MITKFSALGQKLFIHDCSEIRSINFSRWNFQSFFQSKRGNLLKFKFDPGTGFRLQKSFRISHINSISGWVHWICSWKNICREINVWIEFFIHHPQLRAARTKQTHLHYKYWLNFQPFSISSIVGWIFYVLHMLSLLSYVCCFSFNIFSRCLDRRDEFLNFLWILFSIEIKDAHKNHRICSLIGVEGGHALGGSLGVLRTYYKLGVRYMTLTSTCHTPWADSSNADAPKHDVKHGGITAYGKVSQWKDF